MLAARNDTAEVYKEQVEVQDELALARAGFKKEIAGLLQDMETFKTDIIKWMLFFWLAQVIMYGLFLLFMKK